MDTKALLSMIFGIVGMLSAFWGLIPFGLSIIAIVLSTMSLNDKSNGLAITGLVTGIIGALTGLFWTAVWAIAFIA